MVDNPKVAEILSTAAKAVSAFDSRYPGEAPADQPIHTVYGGAHLFTVDSISKLEHLALKSFEDYAPNAASFAAAFELADKSLAAGVYERLRSTLKSGCVKDFRIDFEDGFGYRADDEEDKAATLAAQATASAARQGKLPASFGIRIKPLNPRAGGRAVRTLELFFDSLMGAGALPSLKRGFVITLPKVVIVEQVSALAEMLTTLEQRHAMSENALKIEIMIEHPQLFSNAEGRSILQDLVRATGGRCLGAHFGAYDYQSTCGIVGSAQSLDHVACDRAREQMKIDLAQMGVALSDGATNEMPIPPHRGFPDLSIAQMEENTACVHGAWRAHFKNVSRALEQGLYQGWDLHPAQIPARYAALYIFFWSRLHDMTGRLRAFAANAARATLSGSTFDDLATGQGLVNFFLRAIACGAIEESDLKATGLGLADLKARSFLLPSLPAD